VKSIAAAYAIAILLGGCMLASETTPAPEPVIAEPELVHSKSDLILTPGETFSESLFVKNAAPGAWTVSLLSAPTGTSILNGVIR
jgi:PBP1b-binding outer membrane lipoprotein LpoB